MFVVQTMKTLPTSDTPQVLVLFSQDMSGVAQQIRHKGFQAKPELFKESSDQGGVLLPTASLNSHEIKKTNWYKVVVFVSSFQIFSEELVKQLGNLKCPLLLVIPIFTSQFQKNEAKDSTLNKIDYLLKPQPILFSQVVSNLSSACLLLVDGLVSKQCLSSSDLSLFQLSTTLSQHKLELPNSLSLITQDQLFEQVVNRLTAPQLGSNVILTSEKISGQVLYQKLSKNLEQCHRHKVAQADFVQPISFGLPPVKTQPISLANNATSDWIATTQSPNLLSTSLKTQVGLIINRLDSWQKTQLPPPNPIVKSPPPSSPINILSATNQKLVFPHQSPNPHNQTQDIIQQSPSSNIRTQDIIQQSPSSNIRTQDITPQPTVSTNQAQDAVSQPPTFNLPQSPTSPPPPANQPLDTQLANIFTKKRAVEKIGHQTHTLHIKSRIRAKSKRRRGLFVGGAVLTGVSLAVLFFVGSYTVVSSSLLNQVESLLTDLTVDQISPPPPTLAVLTNLLDWQNQFYDHLFDESIMKQPINSVALAKALARLSLVDQNRQKAIHQIFTNLFVSNQTDLLNLEQAVALQNVRLDVWHELLSIMRSGSENNTSQSEELEKDLVALQSDLAILANLSPHLTQLLGFDAPKKYAVVFQNTQELRSTGGFIQSLGIVTIDQGQITSTQAYSSYEIDKMLGGVVEAPAELVKQLGEKQLYFRDSNWDANFPTSAETMTWFIEKSLNTKLDGVLAITTASLQDILSVTGPLVLSDSHQTVSAQNLLERLENNSGVQGLTPNQPREYSTQIMSAVLDKLSELNPEQTKQLLVALSSSLKDANSLVFNQESTVQQAMVDLGWSGTVLSPPCPNPFGQKSCRIDPFYLNEKNIGINKANQYLQRKNLAKIKVDQSSIKYRLQISYENYADVSSWPKGSYLVYAQAFLPPNANQLKIAVDGVEIDDKALTTTQWENRSVVGFNLEVPIKSTKQVEIDFETPPLNNENAYVFFMQKQPGVSLHQSQVEIDLLEGKVPLAVSPGAVVEENRVVFSPTPNPHLLVGLSF